MPDTRPIQLVVARSDSVHQGVNRALMLARYLRAPIHIVLCGEGGLQTLTEERGAQAREDAGLYVEALRKSISAPDVPITTTIALDGLLPQCAAQAARIHPPQLVVKAAVGSPGGFGRNDWDLVSQCPAPLLLTHGRPWHPLARFAAAVEIPDRSYSGAALEVARVSLALSDACGAQLDLICAEPEPLMPSAPEGESAPALARQRLSGTLGLSAEHVHQLAGAPAEVLPPFIARRGYDLIVVGSHPYASRKDFAVATTGRLLSSVGCDLLFIPEDRTTPLTSADLHATA
jgi:nucleotide-binding universal stress UspA family protein